MVTIMTGAGHLPGQQHAPQHLAEGRARQHAAGAAGLGLQHAEQRRRDERARRDEATHPHDERQHVDVAQHDHLPILVRSAAFGRVRRFFGVARLRSALLHSGPEDFA